MFISDAFRHLPDSGSGNLSENLSPDPLGLPDLLLCFPLLCSICNIARIISNVKR